MYQWGDNPDQQPLLARKVKRICEFQLAKSFQGLWMEEVAHSHPIAVVDP